MHSKTRCFPCGTDLPTPKMPAFDIRTAFLIIGLLYMILPTIVWIVLAKQRSRQVALWCVGGLMFGFAAIFTAIYGNTQEWVFLSLAVLFFYAGNFARIQSLRLDLGIPWSPRWMVGALIALVLVFHGLHYGIGDIPRAQFNSLVGMVQIAILATLAWRIGREEESLSAKWIAGVYFLVAMMFLYRIVTLIGFSGKVGFVNEGFISQLLALTILLAAVVGHFGYVGLHLDRSMRRELKTVADLARDEEKRRLSEQIAQLDRQRSLGEMSASLGHELNQPLTAILTNAQVAQRGLRSGHYDTDQLGEFLDKIVQNSRRASQIIERIRGFIRPSVARNEPVHLNRILLEVADLVADDARSRKVSLVFPDKTGPIQVMGDPIQLSQILLNAFRNAIESMHQAARREIRVTCASADGRAILRIRDTGPGLSPEALAQAGTPFYTSKPSGLGMGLSISRAIAEQHGGTLTIANADEGGAVVELNLPALPEAKT